jgi:hypothetical protein
MENGVAGCVVLCYTVNKAASVWWNFHANLVLF